MRLDKTGYESYVTVIFDHFWHCEMASPEAKPDAKPYVTEDGTEYRHLFCDYSYVIWLAIFVSEE